MLALAWPLALTNLSQHALALTDSVFLGWLSTEALAAATLGANLYWAVMAAPLGTAFAASPLLSQARGAGRRPGGHGWMRQMRRGARGALCASLGLLGPSLLLLWYAEPLLLALGQEPHLAAPAGAYLRAMMWGLPPFCGFIVLRGFLAAMERPGPALWVAGCGILLNGLLCRLLVFGGFGWDGLGMVGAGLSSALANLAMLLGLLALIARDRRLRRFRILGGLRPGRGIQPLRRFRRDASRAEPGRGIQRLRRFRRDASRFGRWRLRGAAPDLRMLREVFRLGLPISGSMLLEIGVFSAAALAMGRFGAAAVAAHAVALQTAGMTFMVPLGLGQAATARVGLFTGAARPRDAARAGWVAVALGAGFMLAMALLLVLAARPIAGLFLGAGDAHAAEAAALAALLLTVAGVFQVADGTQAVAAGALRGLKDTRVPMLLAALGYWGIGMPVGLVLAAWIGPVGLWIGLAAGLGVVALLMLRRWRRLSNASLDREAAARA